MVLLSINTYGSSVHKYESANKVYYPGNFSAVFLFLVNSCFININANYSTVSSQFSIMRKKTLDISSAYRFSSFYFSFLGEADLCVCRLRILKFIKPYCERGDKQLEFVNGYHILLNIILLFSFFIAIL